MCCFLAQDFLPHHCVRDGTRAPDFSTNRLPHRKSAHTTTSCFCLIHKTFVLMRYVEPLPCFFASLGFVFSEVSCCCSSSSVFSFFFCVCRYGIIRFATAFYYMCLAVCMLFLSLGFRRVSQSILENFALFFLSLSLMTSRGSAFFLSFYRK